MRKSAAPKMLYNTTLPTTSGVDVLRIADRYAVNMNKSVASGIGLGVDGQTQAYIDVRGKKAKALFASKYVPMTDGTDVLTSLPQKLMSQRGYGNVPACYPVDVPTRARIGFDNTLVSIGGRTGDKMASIYQAPIIHHANNAVYTDFPKGPGGQNPNPMWEDGTYDEMLAQVQKQHVAVPEEIKFLPPHDPRKSQFNAQALAGGEVYGNALLRKEISDYVAGQEKQKREIKARTVLPYGRPEEIEQVVREITTKENADKIAKKLGAGFSSESALVKQLAQIQTEAELPALSREIPTELVREISNINSASGQDITPFVAEARRADIASAIESGTGRELIPRKGVATIENVPVAKNPKTGKYEIIPSARAVLESAGSLARQTGQYLGAGVEKIKKSPILPGIYNAYTGAGVRGSPVVQGITNVVEPIMRQADVERQLARLGPRRILGGGTSSLGPVFSQNVTDLVPFQPRTSAASRLESPGGASTLARYTRRKGSNQGSSVSGAPSVESRLPANPRELYYGAGELGQSGGRQPSMLEQIRQAFSEGRNSASSSSSSLSLPAPPKRKSK
jgi:hypothetical protein